ncbi:MAG TPA: NAD(+)/NADH kinase [Candidatus Dormibacteraeota bacterium]|jgi:NAD+ kinase
MTDAATVLFVLHSRVPGDEAAVVEARRYLEAHGHPVRVFQRQAPDEKPGRFGGGWVLPDEELNGVALVVTFGGDGTFLRAARAAIARGLPLLGINLGRLGFLAWVTLEEAAGALREWVEGRTTIETRATLTVELNGDSRLAINEAALLKDPAANVIQLEVSSGGTAVGMFHADGVVVATPTGSTAYAASAGGPILDPAVSAIVLVPLNPHTLASRALVLPGEAPVLLQVDEATRLLLDGALNLAVPSHSTLRCSLDGPPLRVVRCPGTSDFYQQLREKMRWGEPLVREGRR